MALAPRAGHGAKEVLESKWAVSKKAGVGKRQGGSEGSLFHVSKQETSYARMSMADRTGKLSSQRARGRHTLKGVRSPLLRPSAMYSSFIHIDYTNKGAGTHALLSGEGNTPSQCDD